MASVRTQIYLTKEQRERIDAVGRREGKSLAQIVREALDEFLVSYGGNAEQALEESFGAIPDLDVPSRKELWGARGSTPR